MTSMQAGSVRRDSALARAAAARDWERLALLVMLAIADALRDAPTATLDDLLAMLVGEEATDDGRAR